MHQNLPPQPVFAVLNFLHEKSACTLNPVMLTLIMYPSYACLLTRASDTVLRLPENPAVVSSDSSDYVKAGYSLTVAGAVPDLNRIPSSSRATVARET